MPKMFAPTPTSSLSKNVSKIVFYIYIFRTLKCLFYSKIYKCQRRKQWKQREQNKKKLDEEKEDKKWKAEKNEKNVNDEKK